MPTSAFTWAASYLLLFSAGPDVEPVLVDAVRAPSPGGVRLLRGGVVEVSAAAGLDLTPHPCIEQFRATEAGWRPERRRCHE